MENAVAIRYEGGIIFRNVRPLDVLIAELEVKKIEYVSVSPDVQKYSTWNLVLVFKDKETREMYESKQVEYTPSWLIDASSVTQRVNPLKAAKRAAKGK